jgi:flavin-dependent dehydrogenase
MTSLTPDVVVVGGGIAGGTMATVLASSGLEVVVLERETTYPDRVRGEWIAPWGVA